MIAIIDYGCGNLFSLSSSLRALQIPAVVTNDRSVLKKADQIILPGVGAFGDAVKKLHATGMYSLLQEAAASGKPLLGICLGMQLLFEKSYEYGEHEGLGLLRGEVCSLAETLPPRTTVPHMGWNNLHFHRPFAAAGTVAEGDYMYFVHSYFARGCRDSLVASVNYGVEVPAIVQSKNVIGMQFHPEKSGQKGLSFLKAFSQL